jgi:hypothetical protein
MIITSLLEIIADLEKLIEKLIEKLNINSATC